MLICIVQSLYFFEMFAKPGLGFLLTMPGPWVPLGSPGFPGARAMAAKRQRQKRCIASRSSSIETSLRCNDRSWKPGSEPRIAGEDHWVFPLHQGEVGKQLHTSRPHNGNWDLWYLQEIYGAWWLNPGIFLWVNYALLSIIGGQPFFTQLDLSENRVGPDSMVI